MTPDPGADLPTFVIGEIRAEIARKGITRTELADTIDRDRDWIFRRLNGTVGITMQDLQQIADGLGVDVRRLLPT
jgi:transcriptional regulator with XRE-family HTH domain